MRVFTSGLAELQHKLLTNDLFEQLRLESGLIRESDGQIK